MAILDLETGKIVSEASSTDRVARDDSLTRNIIDLDTGKVQQAKGVSSKASAEEMRAALQDINADIGPFDAAMIAAGRTMMEVPRMMGLAEPEPEIVTSAFRQLEQQRPISTTVGSALPFVAPGVGIGAIPQVGGRIVAGGLLGAAEGATVASAGDKDIQSGAGVGAVIGAGAEALFPVLGRVASQVWQRLKGRAPNSTLINPDGTPTQEFAEALQQANIRYEDIVVESQQQLARLPSGTDPQQAARLASLQSVGAPATRGDVLGATERGGFEQQALEARLVESTDPLADELRRVRLEQSRAFSNTLQRNVDELGVPDRVGESIKDALTGRKTLLKQQKNSLYAQAAEMSEDLGAMPVFSDTLVDALPDARTMRRLARREGNQIKPLEDLMVEFGIIRDPEKVKAFIDAGGEIEPLSLRNFEDFRQEISALERADKTGATLVASGPVKQALDDELDVAFNAMEGVANQNNAELLATIKQARSTTRELKTEFSPQSISGRLIDVKRDGVTPIIEASKVYPSLIAKGAPEELLDRTLTNLEKSGVKGQAAIKDLQAAAIMDLLDSAFKASSRKIQGERVFGQAAFANRLRDIGDKRLERLFKGNEKALADIRRVAAASEITQPPASAQPKGSASVLLDVLKNIGVMSLTQKVPGIGPALSNIISTALEKGGNRAAVERSLKAIPERRRKQVLDMLENEFVGLGSAIGIVGAVDQQEKE